MKIVFLQQLWYEWQAPMIFSAIAKEKGHECVMYIGLSAANAARKVYKEDADLVVFSSIISGNMQYVYDCSKSIKKLKNIPILAGGVFISLYYEKINMENIDFLGIGEGEYTFSFLLDALRNKDSYYDIPGLGYMKEGNLLVNKSKFVRNLDELPFMDRDLYYRYFLFKKEGVRMFYSGRGCKYKCSYCCVPNLVPKNFKSDIRKKSPQRLISEIQDVQKKYGLKTVFFQDDCFTQDYNWLIEFLILYKKEINKPLMCMSRAVDLNEEVVTALANSGCISIGIGLETSNECLRNKLNRKENNLQIEQAIKMLHAHNIKITTFNMLGIPGENLESIMQTIKFNRDNKVESPWGILYQPYLNEVSNLTIKDNENFYSELGYEHSDKTNIEIIQKLFSLLVRFPRLQKTILQLIPKQLAVIIFSVQSFVREVTIWKRSFFLTLVVGIKNQLIYKFAKRRKMFNEYYK